MRVLVVTPYLPAPPNTGGRRRMHALVSRLSRSHDVTVVSFVDADGEHDAVAATHEIARRVVTVRNADASAKGLRKRWLQLRSLVSGRSYAHLVFTKLPMQQRIDDLAREQLFDVVIVEFAHMAHYVFPSAGPVVLDEHNIEYDLLQRSAKSGRGALAWLFESCEYRKLRTEERRAWSRVDGCLFTSERDRAVARQAGCAVPTAVVPNGVDTAEFAPDGAAGAADILFFGADFFPNTDALRFFADDVLPEVRHQRPGTRLRVVGGCVGALADRSREGVELVGRVPDVRSAIAKAAVVIAPLRVGGGTRLKILEAMAMGRPVVATQVGAEGIDAIDGRDLLIANDATGLARATVRLLRDSELAETIGAAGRDLVVREYDWDASARRLHRFIRGLLGSRRAFWPMPQRERAS